MLEDGRCYPIGTYGPADPGAVALLPGIFGGGGDSTFVPQDQSGLPPGYAGPGSISVISPAPPLIGQRPGDVVDQDNNGTIDYLAPPSRWR